MCVCVCAWVCVCVSECGVCVCVCVCVCVLGVVCVCVCVGCLIQLGQHVGGDTIHNNNTEFTSHTDTVPPCLLMQ